MRMRRQLFAWFLSALGLLVVGGCERKGPVVPPPASTATGMEVPSEVDTPSVTSTLGPGIRCVLLPAVPTKLSPPAVFLQGVRPGKETPRIVDVLWYVNDIEFRGGARLDPSRFAKGNRIHARASILYGGEERQMDLPVVVVGNSPPWIEDAHLEPQGPLTGSVVRAVVKATDPDGDPLTFRYTWFADDRRVREGADTFALNGVKKGAWIHFQVIPNDGSAEGGWKYSPKYKVLNSPPVVKNAPPSSIAPGGVFTHTIEARDPDGDPVAFSLEKAPPGMTLSGATLGWTVPEDAYGKNVEVVVRVSDNDGGVTQTTFSMVPRK
jgi:predicted small lipoprotein YifL